MLESCESCVDESEVPRHLGDGLLLHYPLHRPALSSFEKAHTSPSGRLGGLVLSLLILLATASGAEPSLPPHSRFAQAPVEAPLAELAHARRLSAELRYEEAVVEYQRYLGRGGRPDAERAVALLELGFLHALLEDSVSAEARIEEALQLDPKVKPAAGAPAKQLALLGEVRAKREARPHLELLPRQTASAPGQVHAALKDPRRQAREVLLRHAASPEGPFLATRMRCTEARCEATLTPPADAKDFTAWYFLEALDAQGNTLARSASPTLPRQLSVVSPRAWYQNPWVYAGGATLVVGAAAVFFAASASR